MDDIYVVEMYWPDFSPEEREEHIYIIGRENADKFFDEQIENWHDEDEPVDVELCMYKAHVTRDGIVTYDWSEDMVRTTQEGT